MNKLPTLSVRNRESVVKAIKSVEITFLKKWRASKYVDLSRFQQDNEKWVHIYLKEISSICSCDSKIFMKKSIFSKGSIFKIVELPHSLTHNNRRGLSQTKKAFDELSERQKNRRAEELASCGLDQLLIASMKAAKNANETDLEYVLGLLHNDHTKATSIRSLLHEQTSMTNTNNE